MIAMVGIDFSASAIVVALLVFALLGWAHAGEQRKRGQWARQDLANVEKESELAIRVAVRCIRPLAHLLKEPIPTWMQSDDETGLPRASFLELLSDRLLERFKSRDRAWLHGYLGGLRMSDAATTSCVLAKHAGPGGEWWELYRVGNDSEFYNGEGQTPKQVSAKIGPITCVWLLSHPGVA